jgi:hypothetical protein
MEFRLNPELMIKVHAQFTEADGHSKTGAFKAVLKAQRLTRLAVFQLANKTDGAEGKKIKNYYLTS